MAILNKINSKFEIFKGFDVPLSVDGQKSSFVPVSYKEDVLYSYSYQTYIDEFKNDWIMDLVIPPENIHITFSEPQKTRLQLIMESIND